MKQFRKLDVSVISDLPVVKRDNKKEVNITQVLMMTWSLYDIRSSSGDNKISDGIIHDTLESLQEHEQTSLCVYTNPFDN